ncbi:hypothetical protein [Rickettsiella massiliensis]|uniref:hypothetical protein n=1 Tax=Rickettsiella massiliensis TaxID=676517 RepID=UPI00029A7BAD|nr:hypothetical protein [Rickettsiella massiliensis]
MFNENKALQEKLKSFAVPENYQLPESVSLSEQELQGLANAAKQGGLNQAQFEKILSTMQEQQQSYQTQLAERKKQLGEQFKVVEDYVAKTYPSALHHTVLATLLGDENAMKDALKHRDQLLNSQVPGLNNQRASYSDPEDAKEALAKISDEYHQNPTEKNRKRYINLASEVTKERSRN